MMCYTFRFSRQHPSVRKQSTLEEVTEIQIIKINEYFHHIHRRLFLHLFPLYWQKGYTYTNALTVSHIYTFTYIHRENEEVKYHVYVCFETTSYLSLSLSLSLYIYRDPNENILSKLIYKESKLSLSIYICRQRERERERET